MKFTKKNRNIIRKILSKTPIFIQKGPICCSIRFYDNYENILQQFKKTLKYVEPILVSNKPNQEVMKGDANSKIYTQIFLQMYPNNKFAQYLLSINNKEIGTTIVFSDSEIDNLYKWTSSNPAKTKIVIFDWDGTLSVIEGINIPENKTKTNQLKMKNITYREIASYYAGTIERLKKIRDMFLYLHSKNVHVYILTNNPTAACNWTKYRHMGIGNESRYNFYRVAKVFIPQLKENNIICGFETNGFKPFSFLKNPFLNQNYNKLRLCHYYNNIFSSI